MKKFRFKKFSDPGHGWLAVSRKLINELGIAPKITAFSYQSDSGRIVYLEEDCDVGTFCDAMRAAGYQFSVLFVRTNNDSRVRRLGDFRL